MSAHFYPSLTEKLIDDAGIVPQDYLFGFTLQGHYYPLRQSGKGKVRLEPINGDWKIERDGLNLKKVIRIETPELLFGGTGILPRSAKLGMCIIWNNASLTQMGVIRPTGISENGRSFTFSHNFLPGEISGSLSLRLNLYIEEPAKELLGDELDLMNEPGVSLGQIEEVQLNLNNEFLDFPTREVSDPSLPLWWLDLKDWEDPTQDPFDINHVRLYINTAHKASKILLDDAKGIDLLVEIVSTSYLLIITKIAEKDCLQRTIDNNDLAPGSISSFIYKFYLDCETKFNANQSPEEMQLTIHDNIDKLLRAKEISE